MPFSRSKEVHFEMHSDSSSDLVVLLVMGPLLPLAALLSWKSSIRLSLFSVSLPLFRDLQISEILRNLLVQSLSPSFSASFCSVQCVSIDCLWYSSYSLATFPSVSRRPLLLCPLSPFPSRKQPAAPLRPLRIGPHTYTHNTTLSSPSQWVSANYFYITISYL